VLLLVGREKLTKVGECFGHLFLLLTHVKSLAAVGHVLIDRIPTALLDHVTGIRAFPVLVGTLFYTALYT